MIIITTIMKILKRIIIIISMIVINCSRVESKSMSRNGSVQIYKRKQSPKIEIIGTI